MSRKMTMPCSNLLTIKYVGLIWFVYQLHIVKITSIKLLTYKITVKHFICTHNIIFEFCHNKKKQCSNEELKEMPLRVQLLSFFLLNPHGRVIPNSSYSENKLFSLPLTST